jgi:hypothetical protein
MLRWYLLISPPSYRLLVRTELEMPGTINGSFNSGDFGWSFIQRWNFIWIYNENMKDERNWTLKPIVGIPRTRSSSFILSHNIVLQSQTLYFLHWESFIHGWISNHACLEFGALSLIESLQSQMSTLKYCLNRMIRTCQISFAGSIVCLSVWMSRPQDWVNKVGMLVVSVQ